MSKRLNKLFFSFLAFLVIFIYIFNPYTKIGPLLYFVSPIFIFCFYYKFKYLGKEVPLSLFLLILISLVGVISSLYHDIFQLNHIKISFSIVLSVFISYVLSVYFFKKGYILNDLVYFITLASVANAIIIISEVLFPEFRGYVESFLVKSGNRDWATGFRYRGLASSGGAGLSLMAPITVVAALHLYKEKYIGIMKVGTFIILTLAATFYTGRSGLILVPLVLFLYIVFTIKKNYLSVSISFIVFSFCFVLYIDEIKDFLILALGQGLFDYSVGFMFKGSDGLTDEGTISTIFKFLKVVPYTFPEVIVGYGFYGGSDFYPWTDSGYSRMLLSVGWVLGISYYLIFFIPYRNIVKIYPFLLLSMAIILLISEAKEPFIFSGYASRVFVFLLVATLVKSNFVYSNLDKSRLVN